MFSLFRKQMESNGNKWNQMETNGNKWNQMESNGIKWKQMETPQTNKLINI